MRIGIDLGGTKIEIAVLDAAGAIVYRARVPTPAGDYAATLAAITSLVAQAERLYGRAYGIGVGTPGSISRSTGAIKNSNSICLNGRNLRADLQSALGRDVCIANDANCFALSEATDGAAAGSAIVFGVILGTGVGGGLVVNGRLLDGPNGITGEWGHNRLALDSEPALHRPRRCYCGRVDCVETVLSGPAMAADHARASGAVPQAQVTAEQIARGAALGEGSCIQTIERYARHLAQALAVVINIVDPDVIVLGGGISNIESLYERVPAHWAKWVFSDQVQTRLVRNRHGDSSGVRGAAWLAA
ncbi:MAG TPA: ROK family protein [Burkholderiaceae bacterium]|nr:ROK family protein [Burkholderiaceae bacterium]